MKQNKNKPFPGLFVIGMTGGVGAGKSTVLSLIRRQYDAYVILADEVGHRLRRPGGTIYRWMVEEYGRDILNPDQTIDPQAVAARAFGSADTMKRLNEATHPLIRDAIVQELEALAASQTESQERIVVLEAALLKEGKLDVLCDEVWYVHAPVSVRIARLMESRGYSRERCEAVIRRQADEDTYRSYADAVIENGTSTEETMRQIQSRLAGRSYPPQGSRKETEIHKREQQ